jgi:hypothetical protein
MKRYLAAAASLAAIGIAGCAMGPAGSAESGWTALFDGASVAGWEPVGDANWKVVDGAAVATSGSGFLLTKADYGDFELRAEFYAEADTNSGIFIRCSERKVISAANCYEVNIWDMRPAPEYGTGAIVDVSKVSAPLPKAGGKWNTYVIVAKGDHLQVTLNGVKTADAHDAKHARGPIGLQYAPGVKKDSGLPIKFRKVEIRPL